MRSRKVSDLKADILVSHLSTVLSHQANICWRAGSESTVDAVYDSLKSNENALYILTDILQQLGGNEISLTKEPFILGPALTYDRKKECFVGENTEQANKFVKSSYREPFVVPDKV